MFRLIALGLCLFIAPSAASAKQWAPVAETDSAKFYWDTDAIVWDDEVATIWIRIERLSAERNKESFALQKWMYDCHEPRIKLLAVTTYKANGSVIGSAEAPRYSMEWSTIVSGSVHSIVHARLCD